MYSICERHLVAVGDAEELVHPLDQLGTERPADVLPPPRRHLADHPFTKDEHQGRSQEFIDGGGLGAIENFL